jgi:uncharacterized membrane protein YdjX (TVP38/TMEM64 family)
MAKKRKKIGIHFLPLIVILCGLSLFFFFRLDRYFSFQSLQDHHVFLMTWTSTHPVLAVGLFMLCYIITILCAVPTTLLLSLTAGFLFGVAHGFAYVILSGVFGAMLFFLMVRAALAEWLTNKMGQKLRHFEKGFQENAFNYILMLRFIPVFPFFVVNMAAALLDVRLSSFLVATFFGIMPSTLVYVSLGHGMEKIFEQHQTPNLAVIFQPHILLPLLALACLAVLPVVYKKWGKR